jgi:hypothetical protein
MHNRAYGPAKPTDSAASNTHGQGLCPLYIAHRQNDALGPIRGTAPGYRLYGTQGQQEFIGAVGYKSSGRPDPGVYKPI